LRAKQLNVTADQGDKIGRIFAQWLTLYFGQFFSKITELATLIGYFFPRLLLCINFAKNCIGQHFGRFFTNSSGHPAADSAARVFAAAELGKSEIPPKISAKQERKKERNGRH
jgi:hypothetical protein